MASSRQDNPEFFRTALERLQSADLKGRGSRFDAEHRRFAVFSRGVVNDESGIPEIDVGADGSNAVASTDAVCLAVPGLDRQPLLVGGGVRRDYRSLIVGNSVADRTELLVCDEHRLDVGGTGKNRKRQNC